MINVPGHIVNKRIKSTVLRHGLETTAQVFVSRPFFWYLFVCCICQVTRSQEGVAGNISATRLTTMMVKVFSSPEITRFYKETDTIS
jgi:hypothetical protein